MWRTHRREWMAGVEKLLCEVKLDRGFPVEARLEHGATPAMLTAALGSPMLATLRRLEATQDGSSAIVEAAASPRLRELREVSLLHREHFTEVAERGVPERLTALRLAFELTSADCDLLLRSPVFAKVVRLTARGSPVPQGSTSRWARIRVPPKLSAMAGMVERLSAHPTLRRLTVTGDAFGDQRRFTELAPLWPNVRFEQITVPGSFELTRETEGTVVTLQNLTAPELIALRPLMPAGTKTVLLMPKHHFAEFGEREVAREKLLKAYAGLNPRTLP